MDSRFRGNDDVQTTNEVHVIVRVKWYYYISIPPLLGYPDIIPFQLDDAA